MLLRSGATRIVFLEIFFEKRKCTIPCLIKFGNTRGEDENLIISWLSVKLLHERTYQLPLLQVSLYIAPYSRQVIPLDETHLDAVRGLI